MPNQEDEMARGSVSPLDTESVMLPDPITASSSMLDPNTFNTTGSEGAAPNIDAADILATYYHEGLHPVLTDPVVHMASERPPMLAENLTATCNILLKLPYEIRSNIYDYIIGHKRKVAPIGNWNDSNGGYPGRRPKAMKVFDSRPRQRIQTLNGIKIASLCMVAKETGS
ncbi:hypothetical protein PVAG01_03319 [Phlyctema vagabunda]|uniref:Uncharacterized protein n=1 Tax=Phlyctema vagabunda TaxID=108571 RepID=A0ABR4PL25_9HELO